MVVIIPLHVFLNAPNKLPNHNIHRDIKLEFLMVAYHVLPKKLPIRDVFHTGDSSGGVLKWQDLDGTQ